MNQSIEQDIQRTYRVILLLCFSTLLFYTLLLIFRNIDNNALTRWDWLIYEYDIEEKRFIRQISFLYIYIISGLFIAYYLSKLAILQSFDLLIPFAISFVSILPFWAQPEVIVDTSRYFAFAKYIELYGIVGFIKGWGDSFEVWTDLFMVPLIFGILFKFFGEGRFIIQLFTTLTFSLSVLLTSLIGRELWDREKGFYAGFFLLAIPYLYSQVPMMLVDIPSMFFYLLSIYLIIQVIKKDSLIWIPMAVFSLILVIFSKYSTWLILLLIPLITFTFSPKGVKLNLKKSFFVYLFMVLILAVVFYYKNDSILKQIQFLCTYQWSGLSRWREGYLSTFFYQAHPAILVFSIFGIYVAWKKRDKSFIIAAWFFIFIFLLQVQRIRYTVPLFPLYALMAAYGLSRLKELRIKQFVILSSFLVSYIIAIHLYLPFLKKVSTINLIKAGKYIDSLPDKSIEVVTLKQREILANSDIAVPILDYAMSKRIIFFIPSKRPDAKKIEKLSLRFTWSYQIPEYYKAARIEPGTPVAVISSIIPDKYPDYVKKRIQRFKKRKVFSEYTGVFAYRTYVTVYHD